MSALVIREARVLTMLIPGEELPPGQGRRGTSMGELGVVPHADVLVESGRVTGVWPVGSSAGAPRNPLPVGAEEVFAHGRVLMPGFVDCHTHACWAGSRVHEWERRLAGATYQEIAAEGGGIMSTVRATRQQSVESLSCGLLMRLDAMRSHGTLTAEVKSGYGLTAEHELNMLAAIVRAGQHIGVTLVPTALLGHAIDTDGGSPAAFVERTIGETLPRVSAAYPGIAVDAFCEKGAWSLEECTRLLEAAVSRGHPIRVHADQFTSLGMVERAVRMGARSVDHLEASTEATLAAVARSETFAVGLPVCGFHVDGRYANLKGVVEHGGKVCVATNYNPGSAPCPSMPMAIALAVRHCGLTPQQAIVAATLNPARLLGFEDRGYIGPGARADLLLLKHSDERSLAYEVGDNPVQARIVGGRLVE